MNSYFDITVYDRGYKRKGWIGSYESFRATINHNAISTLSLGLPADHPMVPAMMDDGARLVVKYDGKLLMSGAVTEPSGSGPAKTAVFTFGCQSDFRSLFGILGWPNPTQDIYHQGYDDDGGELGDYDRRTGPAETVVKQFVQVNAQRLGIPVYVAPDLGRGAVITVSMRMHPLPDRLFPAVDDAGIGVLVRQTVPADGVGLGLIVDCYEPQVRTRVLSESSGILANWSWSRAMPTATRVIVGGQGEAIDRDFQLLTDTDREAAYNTTIEVFKDARDVELGNYPLLLKRGQQALDEGAPKAGLQLTFMETETFRYGRTVNVGDQVTAQVAPGITITDVLRSATLEHTTSDGLTITPAVGEPSDTQAMLVARTLSKLGSAVRSLYSGR